MAQKELDHSHIGAGVQEVSCETVTKGMDRRLLGDAGALQGALADAVDGTSGEGLSCPLGWKKPLPRPLRTPVLTEECEENSGERDHAVFLALALTDMDNPARAVDIGNLQSGDLRHSKSCSVAGREDCPVLGIGDGVEELEHLIPGEDRGKVLFLSCHGYVLQDPRPADRDLVEESESRGEGIDDSAGNSSLGGEIRQEPPDFVWTESVGRAAKVPGEKSDVAEVIVDRVRRVVSHPHIFKHTQTQWRHWLETAMPPKRDLVEEPQCVDDLRQNLRRDPLLGEEMGLVITDMAHSEPIGGRAEVFGEAGDVFDVA